MHGMSLVSSVSPRIVGSSWRLLLPSTVRHGFGRRHHPGKLLTMPGMCPCPVAPVGGVAIAVGHVALYV